MRKDSRLDEIMKICRLEGFVSIKMLAEKLNVSEITIRRDLELLEKLELVKRDRKGAVPVESQSLNDFVRYNLIDEYNREVEQKVKIGKRAVTMIQPGETIIFDSGSTLWYMVQSLPEKLPITGICYGLYIAETLSKKHINQLIILGGLYHSDMDMFESISDVDVLSGIRAEKGFISAFGIHLKIGLTSGSFFASLMRKRIISSSEKVILLADSSKFGKIEWAHFANIDEIDTIITDEGISSDYIESFREKGIKLIVV